MCRYDFIGILLMAAYPNALFDLCGICCGHFRMPFWKFFGATFLGKAVIKVRWVQVCDQGKMRKTLEALRLG